MDIRQTRQGGILVLSISGRVDARWAETLDAELAESLRGGARHLILEMKNVAFISSAGIRVLIKYYKQLKALDGNLGIADPSETVKSVIALSGLDGLLAPEIGVSEAPLDLADAPKAYETETLLIRHYEPDATAMLAGTLAGDPERLAAVGYTASDALALPLSPDVMAVGLGAFGETFDDCRGRFGEFLSVGGVACYLPADATDDPDFLIASGTFRPMTQVLYAVCGTGGFSHFLDFAPKEKDCATPFSDLVRLAFDHVPNADHLAMVMVADTAGLIGASLKRSPGAGSQNSLTFDHPQVRDWISYLSEPSFSRSMTLGVGMASMAPDPRMKKFVRPMGVSGGLWGHFHAAVFTYPFLAGGRLKLNDTVEMLFKKEKLLGLLHLINDSREISGAGESRFTRGAMWIGPLKFSNASVG